MSRSLAIILMGFDPSEGAIQPYEKSYKQEKGQNGLLREISVHALTKSTIRFCLTFYKRNSMITALSDF